MHITNTISNYFGKFATKRFPPILQRLINYFYVKLMGLDMREFKSFEEYKSLNELFTRELIIKRKIDETKNIFISPTDSFITQSGNLKNDIALQIKGMEYGIEELLTYYCQENFSRIQDGCYMNFYLSPKDYHRYHAPCDFELKKLIHVPGKLYPVNLKYLNKKFELFIENERVILECQSDGKIFYMVFVGALNVGQMVFDFEKRVETNKVTNEIKVYNYDNIQISKAQCMGYFKMGSTVVIIWEKDSVRLENIINKKISFGSKVADKL